MSKNLIIYSILAIAIVMPLSISAEDYQIRLWSDRYKGSELLFQPSLIGLEYANITKTFEIILSQLTEDQRQRILSNIVILGGNSLVPGFDTRVKEELTRLNKIHTNINILNQLPNDRAVQPWKGAALYAKLWQLGEHPNWQMPNFTMTKD